MRERIEEGREWRKGGRTQEGGGGDKTGTGMGTSWAGLDWATDSKVSKSASLSLHFHGSLQRHAFTRVAVNSLDGR